MKKEKEPRDNEVDYNYLNPVDLTKLGTDDDPCFGTHDAKNNSCKICGDSVACQIKQGQSLHKTRDKIESKQKFKDLDMEVNTTYLDKIKIEEVIVKLAKLGPVSKQQLLKSVISKLDTENRVEKEHIQKAIISIVRENSKLKFIKQNKKRFVVWKKI